jgi:predicted N-acetyltransferase YhbS
LREFFLLLRTSSSTTIADGVRMRPLHIEDLDAAQALSVEVQWPHRSMDWRHASSLGEGIVAERDGQVIGTGMRWTWGERHATLGMIIVTQRYQGQRIGTRIMQTLLDELEEREVSLYATTAGLGLYERSGFVITGDVRQHQGIVAPAPLTPFLPGERLRPAGRNDPLKLAALDMQAMGMPRDRALRMLLDQGEVVVLDRDMEAVGFAVMRRFGRGLVVGPVIAPDLHGAKALIAHFTRLAAGRFLRVDVHANGDLIEWIEGLGLRRVAMAIPMSNGARAATGAIRSFALLSQSLG